METIMPVAVPAQRASQQGQRRHDKYDRLVAAARSLPTLKVAVAHPCDATSLGAVVEATELGMIGPILAWVIPTNEELVIARQTQGVLDATRARLAS